MKNYDLIDPAVIYSMQEQLREIRDLITLQRADTAQKTVLNLSEASVYTGLSKSHLYKLTSTGGIPCYKRGKHLNFKLEELEAWLLSNRKVTSEEIEAKASKYVTLNKRGVA